MAITLTEAARSRLLTSLDAAGADTVGFTLDGKGCGGMSYVLDIIAREDVDPRDVIVPLDPTRILAVDHAVLPFVDRTHVDWVETLSAGRFTYANPQADSACGCGSSFNPRGGCA